jgi:isoleucyl-tRNA synthetase
MGSRTSTRHAYPAVDQQALLPDVEREILAFWERDGTFRASVERHPQGPEEYVFYDGPPFANGLPHYGHLLTGFVKDAVPRYQTMRGHRVERRFGWDCHGLPAEMEAEKQLGVAGRRQVIDFGIERFNDYCRTSVLRYAGEWRAYVTRQARWVDFEHGYQTMDRSYMESVLWAFKRLWEQGLIYEGTRVLPYCWECETPLSNFETRLDDAYRERQDPAVTVCFTLEAPLSGEVETRLLAWTTTPWTLPSNLALAVGPELEYAIVERDGVRYVLGAAALDADAGEFGAARRVGTIPGRELVGRRYRPLFPFFQGTPGAFRVLAGDFVQATDGTGIVHLAPGFGEDDQRLGEANGIPVVCPVDDRARFTAEVPPYAGMQVFDANDAIIRDLRAGGALLRHERYLHGYPHCWRTDTPLIYKAVGSWFVRVTAVKDRLLELNKQIDWVPEHVRDGAFGRWLENARDWSISRNRFWGSPIPVWRSDDPAHPRVDVYGSLAELRRDFAVPLTDLHRPAIDRLVRPNPDDPTGRSMMRRVPEVLDVWFDSGAMPFAQVHYPFERTDWFERHFPADFIVEYIGQTRGWFYTLHVLSTALFDKPAFSTCVVHGVLLGDDGRKLSKRLRNYPDPQEMFDTYGADAMRWFLLSSAVLRGQDIVVGREGIAEAVRQVLRPLWNAWSFFSLYANSDGVRARRRSDAAGVLDRYILAKTRELIDRVRAAMDASELAEACGHVQSFIDALNNWYIRRGRDRFWRQGDDQDKRDAYDTLATVLELLCRVAAPLLPMITEAVYRGLTGERSVHLSAWPQADELPRDPELVAGMDAARAVCSAALSIRAAHNLRVRLPLAGLTVAGPVADRLRPFVRLIQQEVNVRTVRLQPRVDQHAALVLAADPRRIGPRLGAATQQVLRAAREQRWRRRGDAVEVAGQLLQPDEFTLRLEPLDEHTSKTLPGDVGVVALDLAVTDELRDEGLARDVVRLVQAARKDAGLDVADPIHLVLDLPDDVARAVDRHRAWIRRQTLARELVIAGPIAEGRRGVLPDGRAVRIGLQAVRATPERESS